MDKDGLESLVGSMPNLRRDLTDEAVADARAAAKANGYVVVPRHLLDELLGWTKFMETEQIRWLGSKERYERCRDAVVEAVGPTT